MTPVGAAAGAGYPPSPAQLLALPKVELHCHLQGTVRQATFWHLAGRAASPLTDDDITAFYTRGDKPVGVLRVLRALDRWLLRTPDDAATVQMVQWVIEQPCDEVPGIGMDYRENDRPPELFGPPMRWHSAAA